MNWFLVVAFILTALIFFNVGFLIGVVWRGNREPPE